MKLKTFLLSVALLFSKLTFATIPFYQAETCPSLAAIKATGIQKVVRSSTRGGWTAFNASQYDTHEKWGLRFSVGCAKDEEEALKIANTDLSLLTQVDGPKYGRDGNDQPYWACFYTGSEHTFVIATTPPDFQSFA